jgi:predicted transcriptional regulator
MSQRDWKILEYIKNNQGCSKQDIVRGMKGDPSRLTVLNCLERLEENKMIVLRKDKPNSQIYHLYINKEDTIVSIIQDLIDFVAAFLKLLQRVKEILKELEVKANNSQTAPGFRVTLRSAEEELLSSIIFIYKNLVDVYIPSALLKWPKITDDNESLDRLNNTFFAKLKEIQFKIGEVIATSNKTDPTSIFKDFLVYERDEIDLSSYYEIFQTFKNFGLKKEFEPVMDLLWKISFDFIPFQHYLLSWGYNENDEILKDWKKMLEMFEMEMQMEAEAEAYL